MELQWPLILFTTLLAWAAGVFGAQCLYALRGQGTRAQMPALITSAALLVVGGIAVFFHLEHWERIFNGFGHLSSGITQELIAIVVLLILLIGALGYFAWQWFEESQLIATQQTQEQQSSQEVGSMQTDETKDATTATAKKTDVPNLAAVLGMTKDEAIAALKHGATETTSKEVNEEGNPVKTNVTVALTDEPADTRSGTPTVYLGLNEDGAVVQAGYSAATASLGYGSLSYVDAVKNEGIIEKTLQEAGVNVPAGSAQLPADKTEYSEYASDGTTLVKESYSFSGTVDLNGAAHEWSALLLYNYSTANTSGNLADTIRIVYVYVNA